MDDRVFPEETRPLPVDRHGSLCQRAPLGRAPCGDGACGKAGLAPQFVKAYVKGDENNADDCREAICEAVGRPTMRFVPIKTVEQQNIQALHRIRSDLVHQRTAKADQMQMGEYGLTVASKGVSGLRRVLPEMLEDAENRLQMDSGAAHGPA